MAPWDVVGYNYLAYHYEEAGKLFPNRVICCTESKPREMLAYWRDVEKYPYLIGDFVWTSQDYIGEAGIGKVIHCAPENAAQDARRLHVAEYPWRAAGAGGFDLLGFEKPEMTYRRIVWGSEETYIAVRDPRHHGEVEIVGRYGWTDCAHSWNWPVEEGHPATVEVYSKASEVELLLNGESLGRVSTEENRAVFETEYHAGVLTAVSFDGEREISRDSVRSGGEAINIRIRADKAKLSANNDELCYASVELVDEHGNVVPWAENELRVEVKGAATLLAFGSARPKTEENYTAGKVKAFHGRALAVLRAGTEKGQATLRVSSEDLPEAVTLFDIR